MKITLFKLSASVIALCVLFLSESSLSADPICKGLTGAAFGQCQAASAVGCDGTETQPKGCSRIEENFKKIVGQVPPWKLGSCPCGTVDAYTEIIKADLGAGFKPVGEIRDHEEIGSGNPYTIIAVGHDFISTDPLILDLHAAPFFSFYPRYSSDQWAKQTCGTFGTSLYSLSDEEATYCVATILKAITDTGIQLIEP